MLPVTAFWVGSLGTGSVTSKLITVPTGLEKVRAKIVSLAAETDFDL
jgi:hypothetical protein